MWMLCTAGTMRRIGAVPLLLGTTGCRVRMTKNGPGEKRPPAATETIFGLPLPRWFSDAKSDEPVKPPTFGSFFASVGGFGAPFEAALRQSSKHLVLHEAKKRNLDVRSVEFEFGNYNQARPYSPVSSAWDAKAPSENPLTEVLAATVWVDAPNAAEADVEELGLVVERKCPLARFRAWHAGRPMTWKRVPSRYDAR